MKKRFATTITNIAFVTNLVPTYRYPIFEQLTRISEFRFRIFVTVPLSASCREAVATLPIKYSVSLNLTHTTNHRPSGTIQSELLPIPLGLAKDLFDARPDVIVAGDWGIRSLVCLGLAKLLGARMVLWSEEIASSAMGRSRLQKILRPFLSRRVDAFLAWGNPARLYLKGLNVAESRIFVCAQAIDNDYWLQQARTLDKQTARNVLGFEGVVFLLVGRAVQLKGFQNFLMAFSRLPRELHSRVSAVIVGDGDYIGDLKALTAERRLDNVSFVGKKMPGELATFYAAADAFIFPSLVDVWGLVVNEAMCFGLPILASQFAGASQAMVANSDLGVIFNPTDIDEFSALLREWTETPPSRKPAACQRVLQDVTFTKSSEAIQRMIVEVTSIGGHNDH